MAKPPPTPPSSDIEGVNRDARVGTPSKDPAEGSADAIARKMAEAKGRPEEGAPAGKEP